MTKSTILFDLDGTLVDTAHDLIRSLNHTLAEAGLEPFTSDYRGRLVGQGSGVMIRRAFTLRGRSPSEAEFERFHTLFAEHYKATMPGESRPYPGVVAALDVLQAADHRLAICTNKDEALATALLERLGLLHRFAAVAGGDTFGVKKPDGGHLVQTIIQAGGVPEFSVMIGDSSNDIAAAKNAGIASACVAFGYSDVPILELHADAVINGFDELTPEFVDALLTKSTRTGIYK